MSKPKPIKHYTASAIIISTDLPRKVLLVHHKKFDKWMQPGGHQEEFENSAEAAIRETEEETGIDLSLFLNASMRIDETASYVPRPNYIVEQHIPKHGKEAEHYHLDMTYVVHVPEQKIAHNKKEHHDARWFTLDEVESINTFEDLRLLLRQEMTK